MEPHKLARLKYVQEGAIKETDEKIQQWEKYHSDYMAVRELLNTLPDKITHDIMVPFGSLAFMPGRLVHTNEILVLLGDNWFVERSAKQAADIAERRLKETEEQLRKLRMQRKLIEPQIEFTSELQAIAEEKDGVVDIQESYNSDEEREWKAKHRENVKKYRKNSQEHKEPVAANQNAGGNGCQGTDAELWARLDELERIETERNELSNLSLDEDVSSITGKNLSLPTPKTLRGERRVHWENQIPPDEEVEEGHSLDSDDDADNEEDEEIYSEALSSVRKLKTILFTHSKMQPDTSGASLQNHPDMPQEGPKIQTPADVIRLVTVANVPKSILKNRDLKPANLEAVQSISMENSSVKSSEKDSTPVSSTMAFSGKVLEKEPLVQDREVNAKSKKMSKFKAQRQSQAPR